MDPKGRLCGKHKSYRLDPMFAFWSIDWNSIFRFNYHTFVLPLTQHYIVGTQLFVAFSQIRIGTTTNPFPPSSNFALLYQIIYTHNVHSISFLSLYLRKTLYFWLFTSILCPLTSLLFHFCCYILFFGSWSLHHFLFLHVFKMCLVSNLVVNEKNAKKECKKEKLITPKGLRLIELGLA